MAIYSGSTHWKWWFSIVMLVYQRVPEATQKKHRPLHRPLEDELLLKLTPALLDLSRRPGNIAMWNLGQHKFGKKMQKNAGISMKIYEHIWKWDEIQIYRWRLWDFEIVVLRWICKLLCTHFANCWYGNVHGSLGTSIGRINQKGVSQNWPSTLRNPRWVAWIDSRSDGWTKNGSRWSWYH
jgi:hypothetical protein